MTKRTAAMDNANRKHVKTEKVLDGLHLVFVPLSRAKSGSVKHRTKAFRDNGAAVSNTVTTRTTHILVPSNYSSRQAIEKIGDLPTDDIKIVNDEWPAACIEKNKVVDTLDYEPPDVENGNSGGEGVENSKQDEQLKHDEERETDNDLNEKSENRKKPDEEISQKSPKHGGVGDGPQKSEKDESSPGNEGNGANNPMSDLERAIQINKLSNHASELLSGGEEDSESDDEDKTQSKKLKGNWAGYLDSRKSNVKNNPNQYIIDLFHMMQEHYSATGEQYRALAYRKAIATLEKQSKPIRTASEAQKLTGIGEGLAMKIEEISKTGSMQKLELAKKDPSADTMRQFQNIYGVGSKTAREWYRQGARSLEDIKARDDLNESQKIGLEHYDDFNTPIPRDVVSAHGEYVKHVAKDLNSSIILYQMGSYRRGEKASNDIDFIMTKEHAKLEELLDLEVQLVDKLREVGYVKCQLSAKRTTTSRWLGATQLKDDPTWRRMDILVVPWAELGASLIYYTGNDLFNRSIRMLAQRSGMHLNQHGLYRQPKSGHEKNYDYENSDLLIEGHDEKKIFKQLGIPWREPSDRIVG